MKKSFLVLAQANSFQSLVSQKIFKAGLTLSAVVCLLFCVSCKKDPPARDQFIATYSVVEACPSGNSNYTVSISTSTKSEEAVLINNFADLGTSATVDATVSGTSITIPSQTLNITATSGQRVAVSLSGTGTISGTTLSVSYSYSIGTTGETCTMNCTKK
jgi:hypothetical protein